MWLRSVRKACENHHRDTCMAQTRGPLLRQPYLLKAWLSPRAKSCLGPTPSQEPWEQAISAHRPRMKTCACAAFCTCLGSQEGGLESGPGDKGQTQVWCRKAKASLCPCPGPVPAARTRAQSALPFRPQILTWSQSPQWGPVNSNRPLLGDSGRFGDRVPWIPGLQLLEAHRGLGGSLEAGTGPPLSPTVLKHPSEPGPGNQATSTSLRNPPPPWSPRAGLVRARPGAGVQLEPGPPPLG